MTIKEKVPLFQYTTFRTGGPADFFCEVSNQEDLISALDFAKEKSLPIFVLGGGSNLLVSDDGFRGLVIKISIKGRKILNKDLNKEEVEIGAGENWDSFVEWSLQNNLKGMENLSLIPGTVGASPVQNIGAYGVEVSDYIKSVTAIKISDGKKIVLSKADCDFSYRNSFFKKNPNQYLIVSVIFSFPKNSTVNISYPDLKKFFENTENTENVKKDLMADEKITAEKVREAVISIRRNKLPDILQHGTAGSFFKNPIISKSKYESLKAKYPGLPSFHLSTTSTAISTTEKEDKVKVPAGWILEHVCGLKGYKRGPVGIYKNQALVIVSEDGAKSSDIKKLADDMIRAVEEHTGITLEPEVQLLGFV